MADRLRLAIDGMHCCGCVSRVTRALESVKGAEIGSVKVGAAELTFRSSQTSEEEIVAAVNRIGFSARIEK
jgi:copper chaperone CopZ